MPKALIIFGSWHGQTRLIAERLAAFAQTRGYDAEVADAKRAPPIEAGDYDIVAVGAAVHGRGHHPAVARWVRHNRAALQRTPSAFFSVSLSAQAPAGSEDARELERLLDKFFARSRWRPQQVVKLVGALPYTRYGPVTRWMMKRIIGGRGGPTDTRRDFDFTDWQAVEAFAKDLFLERGVAKGPPREGERESPQPPP